MNDGPREGVGALRLVSGGQTGVDRAALDAALALGLPCGGWCPAGRRAEDGAIAARYPLRETPAADPAQRTGWNVRDSDATLLLCPRGVSSPGTEWTQRCAERLGRPWHRAAPEPDALHDAARWLAAQAPAVLNVAGPRESEAPGVYAAARTWLEALLGETRRRAPILRAPI